MNPGDPFDPMNQLMNPMNPLSPLHPHVMGGRRANPRAVMVALVAALLVAAGMMGLILLR